MREIKFRFWQKEDKEMSEPFTLEDGFCAGAGSPYCYLERDCVAMQFTGLKDKNGKEIYEGDIITLDGENWKIYWNDLHAGFWYDPVREHDCSINMCYMYQNAEVIGNIYENPEKLD